MNHHQNVIQFNKILKTFVQINVNFLKIYIFNHVCHSKYLKNQLNFFPFRQISIKSEILKLMFV
jgi:hypothetical protein